jgi:hypothetical protein
MKPLLCTGKLLIYDFHPILIDLAHSTTLQMHCQPNLSKEVSKVILMKQFLCIGKLLSSSFHPIPIDPNH